MGTLLLVCALALLPAFRSFAYQFFSMPIGSMKPTLLIGDYFVASKYAYGYSRYSLPWSPQLFDGRVFAAQPRYGDVVVFRLPRDPPTDYVKWVVGLPGDRVQMIHGLPHINGVAVKQEQIEDFVETDAPGRTTRVKQWRETLPNGATRPSIFILTDSGTMPAYMLCPPRVTLYWATTEAVRRTAAHHKLHMYRSKIWWAESIESFFPSIANRAQKISRCRSSAWAWRYANQPISSPRRARSAAARSRRRQGR